MRVLAAALLGLIAASPSSAEPAFEYKQLGDTAWTTTEWNGAAPKPQLVPTLAFFPNNRFSAHAGCNRYTGRYSVAGERIAFTAEGSTKMACQGERGETDMRMLADLKRIARLSLTPDGKLLVAHAADGAAIMKMRCTKNC
jgi:heat shock protein HslJ